MQESSRYHLAVRRQLGNGVLDLVFTPASGEALRFMAGQFVMLQLMDVAGKPWRQKAYSIASSPLRRDALEFGIKVVGEFTQAIAKLKLGDPVDVHGPHGVFTLRPDMHDVVFLAGGIGITPFLSILREETDARSTNALTLLYANKTKDDIAFFDELVDVAKRNPRVRVCFFVETGDVPAVPDAASGRITAEKIKNYCPTLSGKDFFLCGPVPFMDAMRACLAEQGVGPEHIKIEKFGEGREQPLTKT